MTDTPTTATATPAPAATSTLATVESAVKSAYDTVQADVTKVVTEVKVDEGKLSRTQLTWVGVLLGFLAFPIVYTLIKHFL